MSSGIKSIKLNSSGIGLGSKVGMVGDDGGVDKIRPGVLGGVMSSNCCLVNKQQIEIKLGTSDIVKYMWSQI